MIGNREVKDRAESACQSHGRVSSAREMFLPVLLLSVSVSQSVLCIEYDKIVKITTTTGDDLESGMNLSEGS